MKPILFNTKMVRAIMDGRKIQTRRIMKPQPPATAIVEMAGRYAVWKFWLDDSSGHLIKPPYNLGDILYVRETWDSEPVTSGGHFRPLGVWYYKADGDLRPDAWRGNWHPSIHMPKKAARIFLRVKRIGVERLRDITIQDAIAEGCEGAICDHPNPEPGIGCTDCLNTGWIESPIIEFAELWDSTIKPVDYEKYGWGANPWVWVIEYERCEKPVEGDGRK